MSDVLLSFRGPPIRQADGKGGVGMYLNKGFVHVDTGEERIWIK